jgi:hypothetical protein
MVCSVFYMAFVAQTQYPSVTEKIFSVVLEAYIDTLEATYHKITQRSGAGSVCVLTF